MSAPADAFREGDVVTGAEIGRHEILTGRVAEIFSSHLLLVRDAVPGRPLLMEAAAATIVERDGVRTPRGGDEYYANAYISPVLRPAPAPKRRPFVSRTLLVAAWAAIAFVSLAILVGTLVIGAHLGGPAGLITVGLLWAAGVYAVSARCSEATDSAVAAQAWSMCATCLAFAAFGSYVAGRWTA